MRAQSFLEFASRTEGRLITVQQENVMLVMELECLSSWLSLLLDVPFILLPSIRAKINRSLKYIPSAVT